MNREIIAPSRSIVSPLLRKDVIPEGANPSLVFDRYLAIWEKSKRSKELYKPLSGFTVNFQTCGKEYESRLKTLHERQKHIVEKTGGEEGGGSATDPYTIAWRLTSGLGNDHPIENGFTLDPLLGVPYLRAAALKGLCRRAAELEDWSKETLFLLFGSQDPLDPRPEIPNVCGDIVFLDAYPSKWPTLDVDVMNVHHRKYYQGAESPLETEDPVPVFFLTVGEDVEYVFRLFSRTARASHVDKMRQALLTGLTIFGVGAKTAVGYGRFRAPVSKGTKWLDEIMEVLSVKHNEPNKLNILRGRALANQWREISDPDLKRAALDEIKRLWQEHGWWDSGGKAANKVKQIYLGE